MLEYVCVAERPLRLGSTGTCSAGAPRTLKQMNTGTDWFLPRPTPAVPPEGSPCPGAGAPSPGCRHGPSGSGTGRSYIGPAGPLPPPLDSPPPRSLALETQKNNPIN